MPDRGAIDPRLMGLLLVIVGLLVLALIAIGVIAP